MLSKPNPTAGIKSLNEPFASSNLKSADFLEFKVKSWNKMILVSYTFIETNYI